MKSYVIYELRLRNVHLYHHFLCQDEDHGPSSVKELVKTVTDKYRGFAEMEEEKERYLNVRMRKLNNYGFRLGLTQTGLYSHRSRTEDGNFSFKKKRNCSTCICLVKKVLISCAVTAQLICAFVFAYACCCFSQAVAQL